MKTALKAIALVLGLVVSLFFGVVLGQASVESKPTFKDPSPRASQAAALPATTPAKKAVVAPTTIEDGTWAVPGEVKPGTYTTTADDYCYWARLKSFGGDLDAILANGNLEPEQRGRITIKKTDRGIQLEGGCRWTLTK